MPKGNFSRKFEDLIDEDCFIGDINDQDLELGEYRRYEAMINEDDL
jgi:hypothetical protein